MYMMAKSNKICNTEVGHLIMSSMASLTGITVEILLKGRDRAEESK